MSKPFIQPQCRYGHGALHPAVADNRSQRSGNVFKLYARLPAGGSVLANRWFPEESIPVRVWECSSCTYTELHQIAAGQE